MITKEEFMRMAHEEFLQKLGIEARRSEDIKSLFGWFYETLADHKIHDSIKLTASCHVDDPFKWVVHAEFDVLGKKEYLDLVAVNLPKSKEKNYTVYCCPSYSNYLCGNNLDSATKEVSSVISKYTVTDIRNQLYMQRGKANG